jgi:hypothetical protein
VPQLRYHGGEQRRDRGEDGEADDGTAAPSPAFGFVAPVDHGGPSLTGPSAARRFPPPRPDSMNGLLS